MLSLDMGHSGLSDGQWFTFAFTDLPHAHPLVPASRSQSGDFLGIPSAITWGTSSYTFLCHGNELLWHIKECGNTLSGVPMCSKMSFKSSLKYYTFILIKLCMHMMDDLLIRMTMAFKCLCLYIGLWWLRCQHICLWLMWINEKSRDQLYVNAK